MSNGQFELAFITIFLMIAVLVQTATFNESKDIYNILNLFSFLGLMATMFGKTTMINGLFIFYEMLLESVQNVWSCYKMD